MIKVGSCHQLMPRTWYIVTTEGIGHGQSIVPILCKPHLPNSSFPDFENPNKNLSLASQTNCDKMLSDPIRSQIIYFYILLFSYIPGLYFFFSYVVIIHLLWRGWGVVIYCKLIPDWIESTWAWISFPAQYRAQIWNTTWRSISIYFIFQTWNLDFQTG